MLFARFGTQLKRAFLFCLIFLILNIMLKIELFRRIFVNDKLENVVFKVVDNTNYTTFLVVEFSENKIANFKNELICETLETTQFPTWQELDNFIREIRTSGVVFI